MEEGIQKVEAYILDHIGIASDVIEELKLVKIIDFIIPKKASHYRITHGQAVKAIILSGLGFQDRWLYSVDRFFKNRPVDVIFGKDITWDYFLKYPLESFLTIDIFTVMYQILIQVLFRYQENLKIKNQR